MNASASSFPGGTSVTLLEVYDDAGPDGLRGGSPHMHLASTECYVVIGGRGSLHTVDADGARETELREGTVVWFTPGTIHRAVNDGGLRVLVLMGNAGLPEAGDAVMTFPEDVVADAARYRAAADLAHDPSVDRAAAAARRRDLAVEGFARIRGAVLAGDFQPLHEFYDAASALVRDRAASWTRIVERGPLAQAAESAEVTRALAGGDAGHLLRSSVQRAPQPLGEPAFGMCGRLRAFDVSGALAAGSASSGSRP